jgi:two-component system, LytTR family, sensor histidine kinase AgrC
MKMMILWLYGVMSFTYTAAYFSLRGWKTKKDIYKYLGTFLLFYIYVSMLESYIIKAQTISIAFLSYFLCVLTLLVINNISLMVSFFYYSIALIMMLPVQIAINLVAISKGISYFEVDYKVQIVIYVCFAVIWLSAYFPLIKLRLYVQENPYNHKVFGWMSVTNLIYLAFYESHLFYSSGNVLVYLLYILILFVFISINIKVLHMYLTKYNENIIHEFRNKFESSILPISEEIRATRHDIKNLLNVIELTEYDESITSSLVAYSQFKEYLCDDILSGIIHRKVLQARSLGILLSVEANVNYEYKPLERHEILTILLNLIDNAIEAISNYQLTEKDISPIIGLTLTRDAAQHSITIFNSGYELSDEEFDYYMLAGHSSKRNNEGHGYGLSNILRIVNKYNGTIRLRHEKFEGTYIVIELQCEV